MMQTSPKNDLLLILLLSRLQACNAFGQHYPKREVRAVCIATVENIDWPSKKGIPAQEQQEEYVKLLDHIQSLGMNAIIMQVRPTVDTFYPSFFLNIGHLI